MAVQPDGKIIVVGTTERQEYNPSFAGIPTVYGGDAIARYNTDGSLDTTFGNNGKVETPLVKNQLGAFGVAIQDGKILITDASGLKQLNADGSVDPDFGTNGVVANASGPIVLDGDKIVTLGGGLRRFNANGSPDTTFGDQGFVSGPSFGQFVIDGQGRIVVVLGIDSVSRYGSDGTLDTTFGSGGSVTVPGASVGSIGQRSIALAPDGKIVWAGSILPGNNQERTSIIQVSRFQPNGALDPTFAASGTQILSVDKDTNVFALRVQPDDKILVAGRSGNLFIGISSTSFSGDVFTARLNSDGTLDPTWGSGGEAKIVDGADSEAFTMAAAPNGQITLAGTDGSDFLVARFAPTFNQSLVEHTYLDLLGRSADPDGLAYFLGLLDRGQISRAQLIETIEVSPEYRRHVVDDVYQDYLSRAPDSSGLDYWTAFLAGGATQEMLTANVLGSEEFYRRVSGGSESTFLNNLFLDVLHRPIDPAGAQYYSQMLALGTSRTEVANLVLVSPESNGVVVSSLYQELLGRTADSEGLTYFTNLLAVGATWEQLNVSFIASDEYFSGL
ncbi:MAG TPA: DUF4214 domain-containing protein [Pirellulales bacterium]|nr:DUF4214 domain-containing protein [Pirellulales bacterium]